MKMYNFNSHVRSRFCEGNIFCYYFDPENVDQNLRQIHLTPYYCVIINLRTTIYKDIFIEFYKVYQMMQ